MIDERDTQTVLVIDDSADIHELIDIRLKAEPVQIVHAHDAKTGIVEANRTRPDLVLLDLDLAGDSGIDVCRALKDDPELAATPVIFLTGTVDVATKVQAFDAGAVDYVTKPFDAFELRARVRAALRTKRYHDMLSTRAQVDALTGLWNRAYFDRVLADQVSVWHRQQAPVALVMIDIDHFKQLNDQHGHPFGDLVLARVADTLRRMTRAGETACRYGGEEFGIVLGNAELAGALATAERLRAAIETLDIRKRDRVPITASFGVASSESVGSSGSFAASDLLQAADKGLYEAKRGGRNRVVCAGTAPSAEPASGGAMMAVRTLRPVVEILRHNAIDASSVFTRIGLSPATLADPNARIPVDSFATAWREAERLLPDPALGIRAASLIDFKIFTVLQKESEYLLLHLAATAPTLGDSFDLLGRYLPITFGPASVTLDRAAPMPELRVVGVESLPSTLVEFIVGMLVFALRDLPIIPIAPTRICFGHPAPPSSAEHERLLGITPRFDAQMTSFALPSSSIETKLRSANPELARRLELRAAEMLQALHRAT